MEKRKVMVFLAYLLMGIGLATAQTNAVRGIVISEEESEPVAGASVSIPGTTIGTTTDADGKFLLTGIPAEVRKFSVSFVGMQTQEVDIRSGEITVRLKADARLLDEVVVVAYGTAKRSSLTGAVSSVNAQAIEKKVGTSVTGALEGTSPGVQVNNTYGEPGADPSIRIRGIGSVNGNNEPLYVVDGVLYDGKISDLNASDIESMTILKDAASAALYGNRAANGVVLISTKRGDSREKPTVTFTTNHGAYTRGIKDYDRLDADRWMEAQWTGLKRYAMTLSSLGYDEATAATYASTHLISDLVKRNIYNAADDQLFDANGNLTASILPGYTDLDWADALERTGYRQEYGLSYASSSDKYNVYASLGYLNESGYIINTDFERYSGRMNASFTPVSWFKGGLNVAATSQSQNMNSNAYGSSYANPFSATRYRAPVYPIYEHQADGSYVLDENGNRVFDTTSDYLSNRHVIFERLNDVETNQRLTADVNTFVTLLLPYGFDVTVKGGKNYTALKYSKYSNPEIGEGALNNGSLSDSEYRYETTNFQQQLNWSQDYGTHHVDALLAHESYKYKRSLVYGTNTNMSIVGNTTMGNFTTNTEHAGYDDTDATESYLARARYNYASRYFIEASFRRDGSSRFSKAHRWGNFYSVGAAWDITQEAFLQDMEWIDFLKLRASYGEVGNNSIGTSSRDGLSYNTNYYAWQALYYMAKNGGDRALVRQTLGAENLKWETTQTVDIALEGRLWNRLDFSVGYFDKRSKDLLFAVPLPSSAGSFIGGSSGNINLTQLQNIGSVSNRGWELSANVNVLRSKDWTWNAGVDATFLKNKIQKLPGGKDIANGDYRRYAEGYSIYEYYTYHYVGVDQLTGQALYTIDPGQAEAATAQGKSVSINGTAYTTDVTYGQKTWAGTALPTVYGSIHTDLSWKGLTLDILMTYSLGGKIFDSPYRSLMSTSMSGASALHSDILKSWNGVPAGITENSANRIDPDGLPAIDHNLSLYNNGFSDRWLVSASYLVLKNIGLSYRLPDRWIRPLKLQQVTLNAGVENAFTLTARQGLNPQYSFAGTQEDTYTTARIFNIGAVIKF